MPRRRPHLPTRTTLAAVVVATGLLLASRTAYGWLAASGSSGSGSVAVGSVADLRAASAPTVSGLRPGGTADLALELANPNPYAVRIDAITLDVARGTGGFSWTAPGCADPSLGFQPQTNGGAGWSIPARTAGVDGRLAVRLPSAVTMGSGADGPCQGASFTIHLAAS